MRKYSLIALVAMAVGMALGAYVFGPILAGPGHARGPLERLGEKIEISGKAAGGPPRMGRGDFEVLAVDGKSLDQPIFIFIQWDSYGTDYSIGKADEKIENGYEYTFIGYMSGQYSGGPDWLQPGSQSPFGLHTFFIPTQLVEKKAIVAAGGATNNP